VSILAEFIRSTCWEQMPVLIGSGLGAGFCLYLASQHPELVSRLILLNPSGSRGCGQHDLPLSARLLSRTPVMNRFLYRNYQSTRSAMHAWLANAVFTDPARLTDETVDVFTTCAQQYGAEHAVFNYFAGRFKFDLESRAKSLTQPVTLLWSGDPAAAPVESPDPLIKAIRHSSLILLKNTGALAAIEDPVQLRAILSEQLEEGLHIL
jgi:pimeloyl-ACP methyl ester carboxylesterase